MKQAHVVITLTVEFEDDGTSLEEQAFDAAKAVIPKDWKAEWEVVWPVFDTPDPKALCAQGIHSWVDATVKLPPYTECTHCGELYGDPE